MGLLHQWAGSNYRLTINTRMMHPEDTAGIPVRKFDGADTWEFLDE